MLNEIVTGAVVWLASNATGRKVARQSFRVLCRVGNFAVKAMPADMAKVFTGTENTIKEIMSDDNMQGSVPVPEKN